MVEIEASDAFSGLNGTLENGTPVIVINKQMSTERKRFTALHELGHALLHFPEDMDEKMEEQYCNIFANEVLMPRQTFFQSIGEKRHDIALVGNHLYFHTPSEPPLCKGDSRDVKNKK